MRAERAGRITLFVAAAMLSASAISITDARSGKSSATPPSPSPSSSSPAEPTTPASSRSPEPTSQPAIDVPAGIQYSPAGSLPTNINWDLRAVETPSGRLMVVGMPPPRTGSSYGRIAAAVLGREGNWKTLTVDDGRGVRPPAGFPRTHGGLRGLSVAAGPSAIVVAGSANYWTPNLQQSTFVPVILRSSDGGHWRRVDLTPKLADGRSFRVDDLIWEGHQFVLVGDISSRTLSARSSIAVFTSHDGITWKTRGTIHGRRWSVSAGSLHSLGGDIVLAGREWACQSTGNYLQSVAAGAMLRLWTSSDGGGSWKAVRLDRTLVTSPKPNPTPGACKSANHDFTKLNDLYGTRGSFLGTYRRRAFMVTADGAQLAVSSDLRHWRKAALTGSADVGTTDSLVGASFDHDLITNDGDGGVLVLSVQPLRDSTGGLPSPEIALHVVGWRSADGGVSWTRLPSGRPLLANGAELFVLRGGGVGMLARGQSNAATFPTDLYTSTAGSLEAWQTCQPAPGANCSFSTLSGSETGADLTGIDLRAASVSGGTDWSGVNLSSALLGYARVAANLARANLSGVQADSAVFSGDLTGADLSGADLGRAQLPASFIHATLDDATLEGIHVSVPADPALENADFSSLDLAGAFFFGGSDTRGDLRGANFAGAKLDNVIFDGVDLTGATFDGASVDGVYWTQTVICPDGEPPQETRSAGAVCGIFP